MNRDWKKRRQYANQLYRYSDKDVEYSIIQIDDDQLVAQVIDFFENGSESVYPAKYVFCNIVYSYFLAKYFGLDFYEQLSDEETLSDSVMYYLYKDHKQVYDNVLAHVYDKLESYPSIAKTRKYFKQEFLIFDEDIVEAV